MIKRREKLETSPRHDAAGDGDLGDPRRPRNLTGRRIGREMEGKREKQRDRMREKKNESAQTDTVRVRKVEREKL